MHQQQTRHSLVDRMKGAAMLDVHTYEEVEADDTATRQAALVVAISAVTQAIGAAGQGEGGRNFIIAVVVALIGWWLSAGVTYFVGAKLFGGTADWGEVARTLGFAQSPLVLAVLGFIPIIGGLVMVVLSIWVLVARIIAIRQALDFSTGKAIATAVVGWLVMVLPLILLAMFTLGAVSRASRGGL